MKNSQKEKFKLNKQQRISILIVVFSLLIYLNRNVLIYRNIITFLETKEVYAKIINEKEGSRGSNLTGFFTYYYEFKANNDLYKNPSYDEKFKIGDSVLVIYSTEFPSINKVKSE